MSPELIVAILAIVLAALGIPAAGFVTYRVVRRAERKSAAERRRVIATGLLTELQSLELALRKIAKHQKAAHSTVRPDDSNFTTFRSDLFLFDPATAQVLVVFYGLVREINNSLMRMRDEGVEPSNQDHRYIRVKAIFAANWIHDLRRLLEAAGGSALPEESVKWARGSEDPTLEPPAFESNKQLESGG